MHVVAGLGNPGEEYAGTRHNVGLSVVRELARRWQLEWQEEQRAARTARGRMGKQIVTLVEPQLYMNRSGDALAHLGLDFEASDLVVVHDELDLPPGRIQVKISGGSAGHRGVESIMEHYGAEFTRIRVGIGKALVAAETAAYVLAQFDPDEQDKITTAIASAADAVECVLERGGQEAMSHFNVRQPLVDPTQLGFATKAS